MDEAMAIFYRYINNLENNWYFMDMFNYRRIFFDFIQQEWRDFKNV